MTRSTPAIISPTVLSFQRPFPLTSGRMLGTPSLDEALTVCPGLVEAIATGRPKAVASSLDLSQAPG
jgi:hypothetical protein